MKILKTLTECKNSPGLVKTEENELTIRMKKE